MRLFISGMVLCMLVSTMLLQGCVTSSGRVGVGWGEENAPPPPHHPGPPPHAPAWGYRAKHEYWYYPDAYVYFDVKRKVYFYMEGSNWKMSTTLPTYYKARLGEHVTIEMDSDTPYIQFEEHKRQYPPGQWKKYRGKGKHKGWEKHKEWD